MKITKEEVLEIWNNKVSSELKVDGSSSSKPVQEKKSAPRVRAKPAASVSAESKDDSAICCYEFKKCLPNWMARSNK